MEKIDITDLSRKNLNLLVVLDTVAETRSAKEAANRLNLTQSALSHSIARLREMFDDPLFVRGRNGFSLTARAEQLVGPVRQTLLSLEGLLKPKSFEPQKADRSFRIGVSECCTILFAGGALGAAHSIAPNADLRFDVFDQHSERRLVEGRLDVAMWPYATLDNQLHSTVLFDDRFVGVIYATHPLAPKVRAGTVTLDDFLAFPQVQTVLYGAEKDDVDNALADLGRRRRVVVTTATFAPGIPILFNSPLIATVSAHVALAAIKICPDLLVFELPFHVKPLPYRMVWHRRNDADPAVSWMRGLLAQVVETVVGDTFVKGKPERRAPEMPVSLERAVPIPVVTRGPEPSATS